MNFKKYGNLLALVSLLSYCENHDHSETTTAYECKIESADFTFDGTNKATTCATMPTEITAKVEDLVVPAGKSYTLYLYGTDGTSGYTVTFNQTSITADLAGGATATASTATLDLSTASSFCVTVHDITVEKHILVYSGETCSGTKLVDHEDDGGTAATLRNVYYKGTDTNVTLTELHITSSSGGHSH